MKKTSTTLDDWKWFMISALAVGIISVLYNLFFPSVEASAILVWINFLEKVFAFVVLGAILLFTPYKQILHLNSLGTIGIFSLLVATFTTGAEAISLSQSINYLYPVFFLTFFRIFSIT